MIHVSSIASPPCYVPDELYLVAEKMKRTRERERERERERDVSLRNQYKKIIPLVILDESR
jgi:hypothetical protein